MTSPAETTINNWSAVVPSTHRLATRSPEPSKSVGVENTVDKDHDPYDLLRYHLAWYMVHLRDVSRKPSKPQSQLSEGNSDPFSRFRNDPTSLLFCEFEDELEPDEFDKAQTFLGEKIGQLKSSSEGMSHELCELKKRLLALQEENGRLLRENEFLWDQCTRK